MGNHHRLTTYGFIFLAHAGAHRFTAQCESLLVRLELAV